VQLKLHDSVYITQSTNWCPGTILDFSQQLKACERTTSASIIKLIGVRTHVPTERDVRKLHRIELTEANPASMVGTYLLRTDA
jgi:hypothetical protein